MRLQDLLLVGVLFVAITIVYSFGGQILAQIQSTQTASTVAYNISGFGLGALSTFGSWFGTIALIVVAAVIMGLIFAYFIFGRER